MKSLEYDARNRLIRAGSSLYVYDTEDHRIAKTEGGKTTRYLVNPHAALSQVLEATTDDESPVYYVYGLGLIGQEQDGEYLTYHYDRRGSTVHGCEGHNS